MQKPLGRGGLQPFATSKFALSIEQLNPFLPGAAPISLWPDRSPSFQQPVVGGLYVMRRKTLSVSLGGCSEEVDVIVYTAAVESASVVTAAPSQRAALQ